MTDFLKVAFPGENMYIGQGVEMYLLDMRHFSQFIAIHLIAGCDSIVCAASIYIDQTIHRDGFFKSCVSWRKSVYRPLLHIFVLYQ